MYTWPRALVLRLMNSRVSIFTALCLFSFSLEAQKGFEIGPWLGASHYFGDLHTELSIPDLRPAGGFGVRYNFDDRISVKGSLNYARLIGTDANSTNTYERQRGLMFFSDIYDITAQGEFNFLPYIHGSDDYGWTPYLLGGLSAFAYSPKAKYEGQTRAFDLRQFGTEGQAIGEEYGRFSWAFSYGIGVKWDLSYEWSINVETVMRSTQTDYLDDVSRAYPDLDILRQTRGATAVTLSDPSGNARPGRQRGNNKTKDSYMTIGVGIMYYFGRVECPDISKHR